MTEPKPTYEELLKWGENADINYKAQTVLQSICVCLGMVCIFGVISNFALLGATAVFESWNLTPEMFKTCNAFLQIGITLTYAYIGWHFIIVALYTYQDDINEFGKKWKLFTKWNREHKVNSGDNP
jgi:predicted small integral membrane protein